MLSRSISPKPSVICLVDEILLSAGKWVDIDGRESMVGVDIEGVDNMVGVLVDEVVRLTIVKETD